MTLGFLCSMLNEDLDIVIEEKSTKITYLTSVYSVLKRRDDLTEKKVLDFDLSQQIIYVK